MNRNKSINQYKPTHHMKTKLLLNMSALKSAGFIVMLAILVGLASSCGGPQDKTAKLQELKKQRDKLSQQIKSLEKEIVAEGGAVDAGIKIPAVVAEKVEPEIFKHFIQVRGTVESDNNIFVPAMRPYIVKRILVKEGDEVKKGQLMAELDNESITQTIREIENGLELATTMYERQKNLWEKKIGTEVAYLQAKTNMEDLKIKLKNAKAEFEKTRIYSPIDGVVDYVAIKEGEAAAPNMGAIRVSNESAQKIVAKVSENYVTNIRRGDKVKVYLPVIDLTLDSKVSAVSRVIDPNNRTINFEVKLPDDDRINPNMLAVVTLNDYTNPEALILPINSIQRSEDRDYVFVAKKNSNTWVAAIKDVHLGKMSTDEVEITGGLKEGDVVITFGFNNISAGDPVDVTFDGKE